MADEQPTPSKKKADLVTEIGTLTYPRAVQHFGKDKALQVLHKVAEIGGHGMFEDSYFLSPLFGGLQMPDPAKVSVPNKADFAGRPDGEFWYQAALEETEEIKKQASANRDAINDYYHEVK